MPMYGAMNDRKTGDIDESEVESNSSIARPPPPPTVVMPDAVCLRGECNHLCDRIELTGEWGMTSAHIDKPDCLSNSFRYTLLDSTHNEDMCQSVPTSGKYIGYFLYDVVRTVIPDELDLKFEENSAGTYNVSGKGHTEAFGSVDISGILEDRGKLTINKFPPSLAPLSPTTAHSPPTPRRTTKRQRTSNVRLHDDFVVGCEESGEDLVEDDPDEVDEDVLDEYDDPSDISSNDTTIDSAVLSRSSLCGGTTFDFSSSMVFFSGMWMPDEDSTQLCPFFYSTSLIEPGTYTGSFCSLSGEVIADEFSLELNRNRDGTYQVHGSGKNRFGSFVIHGRREGASEGGEMILHRTYTHVEEDTTGNKSKPLFLGESFADMNCSKRGCKHNHVSPSESSEGVDDDEVDEDDDEMLSEEVLKELQNKFEQHPRFQPTRQKEEPADWEETSEITRDALENGRAETKKKLDDIVAKHPFVKDLVNYFLPMIELAVPSDKIYLVLLHCALQWSRNHVNANIGGLCAHGNPDDLKDSTCCTLRVIRAFSEYLKDHGDPAFHMGHVADALGCINGRQGFCRTLSRRFQRCSDLDDDDHPEVVVEVLTTVLDHFNKFDIPTFIFSLAGVTTKVNEKILDEIKKSDYDAVTVCPVKVYHAQHLDVPTPSTAEDVDYADTCLRTSKKMTESTSNVSKCLEGHFNKCGHSAPTLSLFEHACGHSDLRMVQKDPTKEMFEGMTTSIKRDKETDKIRAYCWKYPDQLVSEAPFYVQEYATRNWIEIYMRRQEYYEQKRSPLLPPESIQDSSFTCRFLLSNMGANSWLVQQKRDGSKKATSERMSAMTSMPQKESVTSNKRKRKKDPKSIKLAPKKNKRKTCSFEGCTNVSQARGFCNAHDEEGKKKRKTCSFEGCTNIVNARGFCRTHDEEGKKKRKTCSFEGCTNAAHARGFCQTHDEEGKKKKRKTCSFEGCTNVAQARGFCNAHDEEGKKKRKTCSFEGCTNIVNARGFCRTHDEEGKKKRKKTCSFEGCTNDDLEPPTYLT